MTHYTGFDTMPIAGSWRAGGYGENADDVNPYSDEVLTSIPLADAHDVDDAFRAAAQAQKSWATTLPSERRKCSFAPLR